MEPFRDRWYRGGMELSILLWPIKLLVVSNCLYFYQPALPMLENAQDKNDSAIISFHTMFFLGLLVESRPSEYNPGHDPQSNAPSNKDLEI